LVGKESQLIEEELEIVKTDFEHLSMIFQFSNLKGESSKPAKCENYKVIQAKVKYLVKTSSKHVLGTTNLNVVLGSQNCMFDKARIGYKPKFQKKIRKFSSFFKYSNKHTLPFQTCFYFLQKGHSARNYRARLFDVPNGLVRWIPKGDYNNSRPKVNRVPTFIH